MIHNKITPRLWEATLETNLERESKHLPHCDRRYNCLEICKKGYKLAKILYCQQTQGSRIEVYNLIEYTPRGNVKQKR